MKQYLLALSLGWISISVMAASRESQWQQVDDAINKGLPKTAIEALEPIIKSALAEQAYGEALKAMARKIVLEGNIQGNKPEEKITRLQAEILKAPPALAPLMDTLLAHWYWHYFQQNRWRFLQRTATAAAGPDFTTWDLPRLFAEIDAQFSKALAAGSILKTTPIGAYRDLLSMGTLPDAYRPTLYDFIAHEALSFYTSGEQAAAKPQDAFDVSADSDLLAAADRFVAWQPPTTDTHSPVFKAIRLYQELLKFHQNDQDPSAFIDADLDRLVFGKNTAFGESKNTRYKAALKVIADRWGDHELAARACVLWAQTLQAENDLVLARAIALRGQQAHPDSLGARMCHNLILEIEAKSAQITTEHVWNAPWPRIQVRYRNVDKVYLRAVAFDWDLFLDRRHNRPDNLTPQERQEVLKKAPALQWSHTLPSTTDYQERLVEFPAPDSLKPGFYFLLASHQPDFSESDNTISVANIWVSQLALIVRPRAGLLEGFVLDAASGEPIVGARVQAWYLDQANRVAVPETATDANGTFAFSRNQNRGYLLRVKHRDQEVASPRDIWWPQYPAPRARPTTLFFTDRAIYRPGQTIHYKGICLNVDPNKDNYSLLAGQALTVIFADPNGKEIARLQHRASDYGSFAGNFTAPRDRLTGQMSLRVENGPAGQAWLRVEEYKRPKFQVTLEAPKTAAKLRDKVSLTGHALSYTGAAIDGAQVKYRVVRAVRMPPWWDWFGDWRRGPSPASASQEIAHGSLQTGADGAFTIEFVAQPDASIPEKDEPVFQFQIFAEVTDTAGETRSEDRTVRVAYTALQVEVSVPDWLTEEQPVLLDITTESLDGEPQVAEGSLKIYRLQSPDQVQRPSLLPRPEGLLQANRDQPPDASDPNQWPLGPLVLEKGFTTDAKGKATVPAPLKVGEYRALLETQDRFGKKVTHPLPLRVLQPAEARLAIRIPHLLAMAKATVEPGEELFALWGTGYEQGRAFVEIEHRGKMVKRYWTPAGRTQAAIQVPVTEAMRGGFTLHVTQVRENRAYLERQHVEVPWSNKDLTIQWEHFTSKLQPNQQETWTAVIRGPQATKAAAEMVATLYDASLDAFVMPSWPRRFEVFRRDDTTAQPEFINQPESFQHWFGHWRSDFQTVEVRYRTFPPDLTENLWGYGFSVRARRSMTTKTALGVESEMMVAPAMAGARFSMDAVVAAAAPAPGGKAMTLGLQMATNQLKDERVGYGGGGLADQRQKGPDLNQVTARKNLNETAFFFPQLLSDTNGIVRLAFTMPEALTEWKFLGFAHDRQTRSGWLEGKTVTAKDLMVQPNPPRFLREGDVLEFTVKVSNQSNQRQKGQVRLTFNNALNEQPVDGLLGNAKTEQAFDIPGKESRSFSWRLTVPDGLSILSYKAVGASATVSDGEEGFLPVLSRRLLVTESLPLPIRGPAEKQFQFKRLLNAGQSTTLRHQSLTVQMVSNPAWYAVLALPYLMEYPHECSEQVFNRLYANSLARFIAMSDPKIRRVFDLWKGTPALDSPLEKNADLKSVLLQETPWIRQAQSESQARRAVGLLFDENRLNYEWDRTLEKLVQMQLGDGAWPWFPGGPANDYITLYITTGFGRLRHLGADVRIDPAVRSLGRLDAWIDRQYRDILQRGNKDENHLNETIALYLYGRSFFLKDHPLEAGPREAVDYFLGQARRYWLKLANRQSQGHLALALKRFGDDPTARAIMKSIQERSVRDEELGLFWRDTELSWWWYRAPIETQALMIEAFDEVMQDTQTVEECRVWLLKQKQTQDWKTTKATADAVYALLLRGRDLLASDKLVEVTIGGINITPSSAPAQTPGSPAPAAEAGTGFYEKRFVGADVKSEMGRIIVHKLDAGVAWGSLHWQYFEDLSKITPFAGTPLKLKKALFVKKTTNRGPVLEAVKGSVSVGDELVVRIELRVDRDMEYVHLKDQRGSGVEPMTVLSGYRYQDGLAYYESTRDTASHFFIDYLPKGTYVFEYSTRVFHQGSYQTGLAEIQCLYAPEFNSHSESLLLQVK